MRFFALFGLATLSSAFVINTFTEDSCNGTPTRLNVIDQTDCLNLPAPVMSVQLEKVGGAGQLGEFFASTGCQSNPSFEAGLDGSGFAPGSCFGSSQFGGPISSISSLSH